MGLGLPLTTIGVLIACLVPTGTQAAVWTYHPTVLAGSATGIPADSPANRVDANTTSSPFAGVGSLFIDEDATPGGPGHLCTGTLIAPQYVLTAAHCLDLDGDGALDATPSAVSFILNYGGDGTHTLAAESLTIHPDFSGLSGSIHDDLAIIRLAAPAPAGVPIYDIHRSTPVTGTIFDSIGYGQSGDGESGYTVVGNQFAKRWGRNVADAFESQDDLGGPMVDEIFFFDFDGPAGSGVMGGPTLGNAIETTFGGGDSGGPSFIDVGGMLSVFGINTFVFDVTEGETTFAAPFFGSGGGGVLVAPYASWIDGITGVPEPGGAAMIALLLCGLCLRRVRSGAARPTRA